MAKPNRFQDSDNTVGFRKQSLTTPTPFSTKTKDLVIFLVQHFFFFPPLAGPFSFVTNRSVLNQLRALMGVWTVLSVAKP